MAGDCAGMRRPNVSSMFGDVGRHQRERHAQAPVRPAGMQRVAADAGHRCQNGVAGRVGLGLAAVLQLPGPAREREDHVVRVGSAAVSGHSTAASSCPEITPSPGSWRMIVMPAKNPSLHQRFDFDAAERAADELAPRRDPLARGELMGRRTAAPAASRDGRCMVKGFMKSPLAADRGRMFSGRIAPLRPHAILRHACGRASDLAFPVSRGSLAVGSNSHKSPKIVAPVPAIVVPGKPLVLRRTD